MNAFVDHLTGMTLLQASEEEENESFNYGVCAMQGWRTEMVSPVGCVTLCGVYNLSWPLMDEHVPEIVLAWEGMTEITSCQLFW